MIVVVQCAARKMPRAGHFVSHDGRRVLFVARPEAMRAGLDGQIYARPDDVAEAGKSWRTLLLDYNEAPAENPYGLLPAWQLYKDPTYGLLRKHYGLDRLYILSAGWGLLSARFLTPAYDITFAPSADPSKRRLKGDNYDDSCMLPPDTSEPIVFFGGKDYVPLFCKLTAGQHRHRTVFYAGKAPDAPDCDLRLFGDPFTNWHYQCAKAVVQGRILVNDGL
ncbi:MAG: hypothetical protein F4X77_01075 [Acidobacteriia bacterium]|nr:hypothetical protein [Terriglobia bacterium]